MSNLEMQVAALMRLCTAEKDTERKRAKEEIRRLLKGGARFAPDPEAEIRRILLELGAPDHLVGHPYLVRGILLALDSREYIDNMTGRLYPRLAEEFHTNPARVERSIRHVIEVAWTRGDMAALDAYFGNTVDANKGKPTNAEFIARIANVVGERMRQTA